MSGRSKRMSLAGRVLVPGLTGPWIEPSYSIESTLGGRRVLPVCDRKVILHEQVGRVILARSSFKAEGEGIVGERIARRDARIVSGCNGPPTLDSHRITAARSMHDRYRSTHSTPTPACQVGRRGIELFLISFLILFFELACIRWFGSTVDLPDVLHEPRADGLLPGDVGRAAWRRRGGSDLINGGDPAGPAGGGPGVRWRCSGYTRYLGV